MTNITLNELRRDFKSQGEIFKQVESEILEGVKNKDTAAIEILYDPPECLKFSNFIWWVITRRGMKIIRSKN